MESYSQSHRGEGRGRLYDERYRQQRHWKLWADVERPALEKLFASLRASGIETVLDFACGTGRITSVLEAHFPTVIGVDISPDMLEVAREKCGKAEFICGDLVGGQVAVPPVDLVTAFRFFPNAEESLRTSAIRALAHQIGPEGRIVFNNHFNTGSVIGRIRALLRRRGVGFMSETQIRDLLESADLEVVDELGMFYLPLWRDSDLMPASWRARSEAWLLRRGLPPNWAMNVVYQARRRGAGA